MRIHYPEEIKKELHALAPYLVFNGYENVVKPDAPAGTKERYDKVREKMHEYDRLHRGF